MIAGLGVDAVDVGRFAGALTRRPSLAARLFTEGERADGGGDVQRLAVRFAAKEATMKALSTGIGGFAWRDVEVVRAESGAPSLVLRDAAAELARRHGVSRLFVSLTHTETTAVAMVVAEA